MGAARRTSRPAARRWRPRLRGPRPGPQTPRAAARQETSPLEGGRRQWRYARIRRCWPCRCAPIRRATTGAGRGGTLPFTHSFVTSNVVVFSLNFYYHRLLPSWFDLLLFHRNHQLRRSSPVDLLLHPNQQLRRGKSNHSSTCTKMMKLLLRH